MNKFSKYIGLDTHKATIAVAICDATGGKARYYGEIANTPKALRKLVMNPGFLSPLRGQFNSDTLAQCFGCTFQSQQRHRRIVRIKQPLQCRAAGLHPVRQLGLVELLFLH